MPRTKIKKVCVENVASGLKKLKVIIYNERLMPTMSAAAIENKVQKPDILSVEGNLKILAAGKNKTSRMAQVPERYRRYFLRVEDSDVDYIDQRDLKNLRLTSGIPGKAEVEYNFLVQGKGKVKIKLDCLKGGKDWKEINLD